MNNCIKGRSAGHSGRLECKTDWLAGAGIAPAAGVGGASAPVTGVGVAGAPGVGVGVAFAPVAGVGGMLSDAIRAVAF
jgi:hypothetical protein